MCRAVSRETENDAKTAKNPLNSGVFGDFFLRIKPKNRQKINLTRFSVKFLQIIFVSSSQIFRAVLLHKFSMIFCLFHSVPKVFLFVRSKTTFLPIGKAKLL